MDKFYSYFQVHDWPNFLIQTGIALTGWFAYIITKRQIPSRTKAKFKIRKSFSQVRTNEEFTVNLDIDIVNLGLAPICIEEYGMSLHKRFTNRNKDKNIVLSPEFKGLELKPGKICKKSFNYPIEEIEDFIYKYGQKGVKFSIYLKYHLGETFHSKWESYAEFSEKFEIEEKHATSTNREYEKLSRDIK